MVVSSAYLSFLIFLLAILIPACASSSLAFLYIFYFIWASLVVQKLKHLPTKQETWVWSLGREDSLEKEMATHSSILAWRIPWSEEPGGLQSTGSQRVGNYWALFFECWVLSQHFHSPLSLSSRGSWVLLHFLPYGGVIWISEVIDTSPRNLDSSLCFI